MFLERWSSRRSEAQSLSSPSPPAKGSADVASPKKSGVFSRWTGKGPSSPFSVDTSLSAAPSGTSGSLASTGSLSKLTSGPLDAVVSAGALSLPSLPLGSPMVAGTRCVASAASFSATSSSAETCQRSSSTSPPGQAQARRSGTAEHASPSSRHAVVEPACPSTLLALCPDLPPAMSRGRWCLEDYDVTSLISQRKTSYIYKAACRASGLPVALKVYQLSQLSLMQTAQLRREISLQIKLTHRNIIRLFAAFQQGSQVVLVQELADSGDLYSMLLKEPGSRMSERRASECVVKPMLRALDYLHSLGIAHRDVKLENVLVHRGEVKLADFGIAIDLREERGVTRAGTLNYLSPEVLACPFKKHPLENKDNLAIGGYSTQVDIWSLGVLAYECLNGASPFATDSKRQTEDLIARGSLPVFLVPNPSEKAVDFVYKCLTLDPLARPTSRELLSHLFVARGPSGTAMGQETAPASPTTNPAFPGAPAAMRVSAPTPSSYAASGPAPMCTSATSSPHGSVATRGYAPSSPHGTTPKRAAQSGAGGSDSVLHILNTTSPSSAQYSHRQSGSASAGDSIMLLDEQAK